ncbi:MAG TPA: protocatechuate 3,4-dioxygenase [Polyangia bacterium]|jgi:protocatechuate 3,4-dioxygenase beta subunit
MKSKLDLQRFTIIDPRAALNRRLILKGFGSALLTAPLLGCSSDDVANDNTVDAGTGGAGGTRGTTADAATGAVAWATGGTVAMTAQATYPNPFANPSDGMAAATCALTCEATQGPCYAAQSEEIQDISYGYLGLPMRVYLRILDESCAPIAGASVDLWHVSAVGKYSGDDATNENVAFCTGNDADFTAHLYFRGKQTTDANGVVFFDTCYPGWYSGRTVHIHMIVRIGDQSYLTTQLFFADTLNDDILTSQTLYSSRGNRDTTNQNDMVVSASAVSDYEFQTQQMTDGALLAWKTLVVRSSLANASCDIPAGAGGGAGGMSGGGPGAPSDS